MSITLALIAIAVQGTKRWLEDSYRDYKEETYKRECALREEGFQQGYRQGNIDAAKKFATHLTQSDNFRIGAFAIGCYIARLGGNSNKKIGVIVDSLGDPNSKILSDYIRSENNQILSNRPGFNEICNKYLDSLNIEQLKSIDDFLMEIINADVSSSNELNFYNNVWKIYLNRRE